MLGRSVERLFERYRSRGDAQALAEVFDRTAPELFRLAQHLVRDPLAAEDVLQETFVAAIDGAARWDAERPLVPWLTGILARQAANLRRRSRRSPEPDRLHARGEADPADLVADEELSAALLNALRELPELYREVLQRHLLDGARPAEIARDLGRAPGTVRMQLFRGLEQLRKVLPAGFAAGAALAAFAPRGLAAVREAVVAHAASVAVAGGVAATAGTKVATLALWKVLGGGLLGLLLAAASFVAWRALVRSTGRASPATPEVAQSGGQPGDRLVGVEVSREARGLGEVAPAAPREPRLRLVGRVFGVSPEELPDARLEVRGVARYRWPYQAALYAAPRADGSYEVDLDPLLALAAEEGPLSAIWVRAHLADHLVADALVDPAAAHAVAGGEGEALRFELVQDLTLRTAALVRGRVVDADGPRSNVQVLLLRMLDGRPLDAEVDSVRSDHEGRFVLHAGEPGEYGVLALERGWRPGFASAALAVGRPVDLAPLALDRGRTLRGRITNAGTPCAGAELELVHEVPASVLTGVERDLHWTGATFAWDSLEATTDAQGRFEVAGLERRPYTLWPRSVGRGVSLLPSAELEVDPLEDIVELELGATLLRLTVTDEDGRALSAQVFGGWDSTIELALGPGEHQDLELRLPGYETKRVPLRAGAPGERREETVVLERSGAGRSLALALSTVGSPLESLTVRVDGDASRPRKVEVERADEVLVQDLPPPPFALELFANGAWRHYQDLLLPARLSLTLSGPQSARSRSVDFVRGGRLRLVVTDSAGVHLPAACRVRDLYGTEQDVRFLRLGPDEQGFAPGERLSDEGPNDVYPNLPAGVYEVELAMEGRATRVLPVRIDAGATSELEVVLP